MPTVKREESSTQRTTYTISNPTKRNPAYKSIHTNYGPFLEYIRNHANIDDATVERAERKFGGMSSSSSSSSGIAFAFAYRTSTTVDCACDPVVSSSVQ
mmetsp:Transcript_19358/g.53956  ORF Transcript_19358/g.53956 Transcript_19358/m.53956 type:complete len:99 (+) Transcript_19358:217-513(+)